MIDIISYLRDPSGDFVPVDRVTARPADERHVEGAIHLTINNVDVIDRSMWDVVDQLWSYLADIVDTLRRTDSATTYFPDRPIELSVARIGGGKVRVWSVVQDAVRGSVVDESRFTSAVRAAGLAFFEALTRLVPGNATTYEDAVRKLSR